MDDLILLVILAVLVAWVLGVFDGGEPEDPMTVAECRRRGGTAVLNLEGDLEECHVPPRPR